jgi:diguanylate cyclase (GGDEF)-like protein
MALTSATTRKATVLVPVVLGVGAIAMILRSLFLPASLGPVVTGLVDEWLYNALQLATGLFVAIVGRRRQNERVAWFTIGAGMVLWCLGNVWWSVFLGADAAVIPPVIPDLLWICSYPLLAIGLVQLLRVRSGGSLPKSAFFDGSIAASAVIALSCALVLKPVLAGEHDSMRIFIFGVIYPVLDVALLGLIVGMASVVGWSIVRSLSPLIGGLIVFVVADVSYYVRSASPMPDNRGWDALWCVALAIMAFAPLKKAAGASNVDVRFGAIVAALAGSSSLGILVLGNSIDINVMGVISATTTIVLVIMRVAVSFHQHQELITAHQVHATTDALTEVFNRRQFTNDMTQRSADSPTASLVLLDLDGFKHFNDSNGHMAGDELLRSVARILEQHLVPNGTGRVYRFGGDEFCAIVNQDGVLSVENRIEEVLRQCREEGIGFSYGVVRLNSESLTIRESLSLCDSFLYDQKRTRKTVEPTIQEADSMALSE